MRFFFFILGVLILLWVIDFIITRLVQVLLRTSQLIRTLSLISIMFFFIGLAINPIYMGEVVHEWLNKAFDFAEWGLDWLHDFFEPYKEKVIMP